MPLATAMKYRREIVARREAGAKFTKIAQDLDMSYATVRNVWHHYQKTGVLSPNYSACVHRDIRKDKAQYERAIELKGAHPSWGAGLIWVELAEEFEEETLASERTLQRWFHRAGLVSKKLKDSVRDVKSGRGVQVHEVWAMDAKEEIKLEDGSYASWLTLSDEGSGAMLDSQTFPPQTLE